MATLSLDNQLQQYLPLLSMEQKQSVLSYVKSFLTTKDPSRRITREEYIIQYNKEIDEAMQRVAAGDFITQEGLEKESETW